MKTIPIMNDATVIVKNTRNLDELDINFIYHSLENNQAICENK